jgi:hypothetical protein
MKTVTRFFINAAVVAGLSGLSAGDAFAEPAKGQDFPDSTCTCKGCGDKGGDLTGKCSNVCKDKTVYSKGSEPHDYCKAARRGPLGTRDRAVPPGGVKAK